MIAEYFFALASVLFGESDFVFVNVILTFSIPDVKDELLFVTCNMNSCESTVTVRRLLSI